MIRIIIIGIFFNTFLFIQAQQKPPVAVNDTVYFDIQLKPVYELKIYPLSNDYSQDMNPIELAGFSGNGTANDSTITIIWFNLDDDDSLLYWIRDMENGLLSEPGVIYLIPKKRNYDWINCNNINARINASSKHFSNYTGLNTYKYFECPINSNRYTISDFQVWVGGYDELHKLHVSPSYKIQSGLGFFSYSPGPISTGSDSIAEIAWNRVWTVYQSDIEEHINRFDQNGYDMPEAILNWPGNGNQSLGHLQMIAPYFDSDEDGIYEPHEGEFPIIKGDMAIYFISSDDWGEHSNDSLYVGLEIHGMAYAYDCPEDPIFQNTIFLDYTLINRSENKYHDVYVGVNTWLGIGSSGDDYSGCDTTLEAFFAYNKDDEDITYPNQVGYGTAPPSQAIMFLNQPLNHFLTHYRDIITYPPYYPMEYYNPLRGIWRDGHPLTYGGIGAGGNIMVDHQFPGNPNNSSEWSMMTGSVDPWYTDYSIGSTGPFTMNSNDTISLELAVTFARDYNGSNMSSLTLLKERLKELRAYYLTDSIPCNDEVTVAEKKTKNDHLIVYPNPFTTSTTIEFTLKGKTKIQISIYNSIGEIVHYIEDEFGQGNHTVSWSPGHLPAGLYYAVLRSEEGVSVMKMVKQ